MARLPDSLERLTGLRAARWSRESTAGQFDAFGPEAQKDQQDRAIERYGLVDTGIAWTVAHSGRTVGNTDQFRDMLARAGTAYDVLVVGYVSRFARDLRTAVNARHDLHAAGASILFADERILTSDEDAWDSWAREAVEAESYSRKLARRISEGYAAKRRRLGEPGGRPPFGWDRDGRPPQLVPNHSRLDVVRDVFDAAASGASDREVAGASHLTIHTVRSILTNPIYVGELRDGTRAAVEPIIDRATWDRVQALRRARNARAGRPAIRRTYTLPMLRCAFCGRGLIGDSGRYRHLNPCDDFTRLRPRKAWKNQLKRTPGHSYPADRYEQLIQPALAYAGELVDRHWMTQAAEAYKAEKPMPDQLGLRRLDAERRRALERYATHRDTSRLEADMARLDAEAERLTAATEWMPDWRQVLARLRDIPQIWEKASPEERKDLASELFEAIDAHGGRGVQVNFRGGVQLMVMVGSTPLAPTITTVRTPWTLTEDEATA